MKEGYEGQIQNTSSQVVEAPMQKTPAKTGTVTTGKDLRAGRK